MSVSLTEDAVQARRKTVTRRLGWKQLEVGDRLTLCRKVMGRRKDEPLVRICDVEVVGVRREQLDDITAGDVLAEGFDDLDPIQFITFFCKHMRCDPWTLVTRIEWRYLEDSPAGLAEPTFEEIAAEKRRDDQ